MFNHYSTLMRALGSGDTTSRVDERAETNCLLMGETIECEFLSFDLYALL